MTVTFRRRSGPRPIDAATEPGKAIDIDVVGYYGQPIVRPHVWKDVIGWYFFTGGLAGASSALALAAELTGRSRLARSARRAAMIGLLPSPALLVYDLGRPSRFLNMLRVFKTTSPMSVGSWLLTVYGPAAAGSMLLGEIGRLRTMQRLLSGVAGITGPGLATYTAVLVADTATPAWHEARSELPFVFAASALASAGAATALLSTVDGEPSRVAGRLAVAGALVEVSAATVMKRRLGSLDTYRSDRQAHRYDQAARALALAGAAGLLVAGRRRMPAALFSVAVAAGSVCERLAVLRAGAASAADPQSVISSGMSTSLMV